MTLSGTLISLQNSVVNILQADSFFNGLTSVNQKAIPIVTEKKGDIKEQIDLCLGQVGIAVLVITPVFEFHNNEIDDLNGWAFINIGIYEDAVVNQGVCGTGIFSIMLAERIVSILHGAPHGVLTGPVGGNPASTCFLGIPRPIEIVSEGPPLQYSIGFQAHVQLNPQAT